MPATATLTPAPLVADELLSYLQIRKGWTGLGYLQAPEAIHDGWETYTYRLQLHGRNQLPAALRGPPSARVYAGPEGLPRLRRDWALRKAFGGKSSWSPGRCWRKRTSAFLAARSCSWNGSKAIRLLERLLNDYFALMWAPAAMADVHARLHQIPPHGLPRPARPFLDRQLEALQEAVDEFRLPGLARARPGCAHRPTEAETPSLRHMDFHAKNILMQGGRVAAVLDWSESDVGDRHADVAVALVMMDTAPVEDATPWDRLVPPIGRRLTRPVPVRLPPPAAAGARGRLRYYRAWAALRRLSWYGSWPNAGPHVMGYKPAAATHVRRGHVAQLERYFRRYSGVAVHLDAPD